MLLKTNPAGYQYLEDGDRVAVALSMSSRHLDGMHAYCIDNVISKCAEEGFLFKTYAKKKILFPTSKGNRRGRIFYQEEYPTILRGIIKYCTKPEYVNSAKQLLARLKEANYDMRVMGMMPTLKPVDTREIIFNSYTVAYEELLELLDKRCRLADQKKTFNKDINKMFKVPSGGRKEVSGETLQVMTTVFVAQKLRLEATRLKDWEAINFIRDIIAYPLLAFLGYK